MEQLLQECADIARQIRQTQNQYLRIMQKIKYVEDGERKKRNHRLITRGAAVESIAPGVKGMGEGEFYELVEHIFDLPEVKAMLPRAGE